MVTTPALLMAEFEVVPFDASTYALPLLVNHHRAKPSTPPPPLFAMNGSTNESELVAGFTHSVTVNWLALKADEAKST